MASAQPRFFADLLRRYRIAAGLTQEELAEHSGLSRRAIGALETGDRRAPHKATVSLLSQALDLNPAEQALLQSAARQRIPRAGIAAPHDPTAGRATSWPSSVTPPRAPLVGRQQELSVLGRHLAGEGPPLCVLVGEAGIGKTRLLEEAMHRGIEGGWTVLWGGCHRRSGQEPYAPFVAALTRFLATRSVAQQHLDLQGCAWLVRLLPELAEHTISPAPSWTLPPSQERRLLFSAVGRFLANVAGPPGTLLVLDDLHWAGSDALDLLAALLREPGPLPLRIVGAYRDTDVAAQDALPLLLGDFTRERLAARHPLPSLERQEADDLLASLLAGSTEATGEPNTPPALIEAALERSGGLPLFLVSWAQELGTGMHAADDAQLAIPWSAAESIRQRLAVLPHNAQQLLSIAAVAGRQIPRALLLRLANSATAFKMPEQDVLMALDAAVYARLLRDETAEDMYIFTHDLIRETIVADLGSARRAVLHGTVAQALEAWLRIRSSGGEEIERRAAELAYHYARSDDHDKALTYLMAAATYARSTGARREEADLLATAIALADSLARLALAAELRGRRGQALHAAGLKPEAARELERALRDLPPDQPTRRVELLICAAEVAYDQRDPAGAGHAARDALSLAEQLGRDDLAASALTAVALSDYARGEVRESRHHFEQAVARAGTRQLVSSLGLEQYGLILYWTGSYAGALTHSRAACELARESHDPVPLVRAHGTLALALAGTGHYDEALRALTTAEDEARRHRLGPWLARSIAIRGGLHLDVGDWDGAEALAEEARALSRAIDWPDTLAAATLDLLMNLTRRGLLERVPELIQQVEEAAVRTPPFHSWLWGLRLAQLRAEVALVRGEWAEATRRANEARAEGGRRGRVKYELVALGTLGRALSGQGQTEAAVARLREAVALARSLGDPLLLLQVVAALLLLEKDVSLLAEARAAVARLRAGLSDSVLTPAFQASAPVRLVEHLAGPDT